MPLYALEPKERPLEPPAPKVLRCPECGEELMWDEKIITTARTDHVVGCSKCLDQHDAGDWLINACDGAYDAYNREAG